MTPNETFHARPALKLHGLDHLRALAIILVFFFHYQMPIFGHPGWLPPLAKFGWTGVDLFFVLSGFLISSQLFEHLQTRSGISLRDFYIKRSFRILPAFFTVIAIYFLCPEFHEREMLQPLWRFLTFTQNLGLDIARYGTFSHAWSLCVEEHFYLLLPVVLLLLSATRILKYSCWLLPALFIGCMVLRLFVWNHVYAPNIEEEDAAIIWYKYIYYPTYSRLDSLLAGVAIAAFRQYAPTWHKVKNYGNLILALGLLVLTGSYFLCYDEHSYGASIFGFSTVAIGYGLLVLGAVCPSSVLFKWRSFVTAGIAMLSYAVYLTHKGVLHVTQSLLTPHGLAADSTWMMIVCIITCLLAALLLHFVVEKPFMRWRNHILRVGGPGSK